VLSRLLRFALTSGAGLALDLALYTLLNEAGVRAGVANLLSASVGVTFVFAVSARHVFAARPDWRRDFTAYAVWQAVSITAASVLVDGLTSLLDGQYLAAKLLVLPLTFSANFLFVSWLFGRRTAPASG
jgi:putative flippase GtrA